MELEQVFARKDEDIDKILWKREKILVGTTLYFNACVKEYYGMVCNQ